jgi:hypothetical protein
MENAQITQCVACCIFSLFLICNSILREVDNGSQGIKERKNGKRSDDRMNR